MVKIMITEDKSFSYEYDVFIDGETIDLCVPCDEPWVMNQWYRWFNDPNVTRFVDHGIFPNTIEKQREFYCKFNENNDRIALLIKPKEKNYLVGVASLSSINHKKRQCDFAMVIGRQDPSNDSLYYAMEAKCLMTEHAFEKVGVERINSWQVMDLIKWQRWQIIFGYHIEGITRNHFRKGHRVYNGMMSSCLLEDYLKLKNQRNGRFWPGKKILFEMLKRLPKKDTTIDQLNRWLSDERENNREILLTIQRSVESL